MPAVINPAVAPAPVDQLSVEPLGVVHAFLAEAVPELLARDDLVYEVDEDLAGWCDIISRAPRTDGRNPAFTPGEGPPPDDAYWVKVSHRDGRVAGIAAGRWLDTDLGFYSYVREGRLWWPEHRPLPVIPTHPGPTGSLAHTGGLWVSPDFGGIGLSWLLPRINHALALTRWDLDWAIGLITSQSIVAKGITANYGAESVELMLDVPFGVGGKQLVMYALPNSRAFLIDRTWRDLLQFRNEEGKKMRDFAPFAKRQDQAPVRGH